MDSKKLAAAMNQYGDMVYRIAMSILCHPEDAEDAVQNTFLRYYRKAPVFNDSEHERAWLIRVAINCARSLSTYRSRHYHEPLEHYRGAAPSSILKELLWCLPPKDRELLQLRYAERYTSEEIAEILGCSSATVRKRLERAKKRAEKIYEKEVLK